MSRLKAIHAALGLYLVAQVLPAFRLSGDLAPGWMATWLSAVGAFIVATSPGAGKALPDRGFDLACVAGAIANTLFVAGVVAAYCRTKWLAPVLSITAFVGAVVSVVSLYASPRGFDPHGGCLLWVSVMGWLAFVTTFAPANQSRPFHE